MRPTTIAPSGIERSFGRSGVIVSKTDLQGRLTYDEWVWDVTNRHAA